MNIEQIYQQTIEKLKVGVRPNLKLGTEDCDFLIQELTLASTHSEKKLQQILCLLANTRTLNFKFSLPLSELFSKTNLSSETTIYLLHACLTQIIGLREREGIRLPEQFVKALSNCLTNKDQEVVHLSLRLIEALGPDGKTFSSLLKSIRPKKIFFCARIEKENKKLIQDLLKQWEK